MDLIKKLRENAGEQHGGVAETSSHVSTIDLRG